MMKWEPSRELIAWGEEHFSGMPLDSVWAPDDSGRGLVSAFTGKR